MRNIKLYRERNDIRFALESIIKRRAWFRVEQFQESFKGVRERSIDFTARPKTFVIFH